jgi:CPA2 family monovalent cation:H+ antiporter-2
VLVIAISDIMATRHVAEAARRLNPGVHIIARTRFVGQVGALQELGANEVVPEEFETSIEIFTRVLARYLVPLEEIERFIAQVRAGSYEMLRSPSHPTAAFRDVAPHLADVEVNTLKVAERSALAGQSLHETDLRARHGVTVLAIRRGEETLAVPSAETRLQGGDQVILLGTRQDIVGVRPLFAGA